MSAQRNLIRWTLLLLCLFPCFLRAQTSPAYTFKIEGEVTKPMTLSAAELSGLKRVEARVKDKDDKEYTYAGYALADILRLAGVPLGAQLRGENLARYLVVQAADGYEAVFALPELDPDFTDRVIFLADRRDGNPLPQETGPVRVIVPGEKKHARWVREVVALKIQFAK